MSSCRIVNNSRKTIRVSRPAPQQARWDHHLATVSDGSHCIGGTIGRYAATIIKAHQTVDLIEAAAIRDGLVGDLATYRAQQRTERLAVSGAHAGSIANAPSCWRCVERLWV